MAAFTYTDFFKTAKKHKFIIPVSTGITVLAALVWMNCVTPRYTAEMVLGPVTQTMPKTNGKTMQIKSEGEQDDAVSDYARAIQLLVSPEVAQNLLQNKKLDIKDRLLSKQGIGYRIKSFVWRLAGQRYNAAQDSAAVAQALQHEVQIDAIGRSAMRRITFRHADRNFAIDVLNAVYKASDDHLRKNAAARAVTQSVYLKATLNHVTQSDQRKVLTKLLSEQERTRVLIAVDLPFAAEQVQEATAPSVADWPSVGLVLCFAFLLGAFAGFSLLYAMAVRQWVLQQA